MDDIVQSLTLQEEAQPKEVKTFRLGGELQLVNFQSVIPVIGEFRISNEKIGHFVNRLLHVALLPRHSRFKIWRIA